MEPLRIGLAGLGFMGSVHLSALLKNPKVKLEAVASNEPARLEGDMSGIQGNFGGPGDRLDFSQMRKYLEWEQICADPGLDAIDLCLPTNLHLQAALAAFKAGKHVLVEKPMALTAADCEKMISAARDAGRQLMVAQVIRFWPEYRTARAKICSGGLGKVLGGTFRRRCAAPGWQMWVYDKGAGGGGIFDLLIHDVDYALTVFGAPKSVRAVGHEALEIGVDWITSVLEYGDFSVEISGGWHHPKAYPFSMEFTIIGEAGTLEFSSAGRPLGFYNAAGEAETVAVEEGDAYATQIGYFVDCCLENKKPEKCLPEESALAVRTTLRMLESRARGGEKLECEGALLTG